MSKTKAVTNRKPREAMMGKTKAATKGLELNSMEYVLRLLHESLEGMRDGSEKPAVSFAKAKAAGKMIEAFRVQIEIFKLGCANAPATVPCMLMMNHHGNGAIADKPGSKSNH